ncbi:trypsin-like serine protease [Pendulispora rubella]|uniref:Trypsin-like serine protease n=1 Tax=Pendulispora rubella TaxID=2741070 RepID=A0ABZ2LJW2_9BACT
MVSLGCAGAPQDADETDEVESPLSGKDGVAPPIAAEGQFASTIHLSTLKVQCTATKVGPRHILTAGHCSLNESGKIEEPFKSGGTLYVSNKAKLVPPGCTRNEPACFVTKEQTALELGYEKVTVEKTVLEPAYAKYPEATGGGSDLAVILLTVESAEKIKDIPSAKIDYSVVRSGDALTLQGYGEDCMQFNERPELRYAGAKAVPSLRATTPDPDLNPPPPPISAALRKKIEKVLFFTDANLRGGPTLCPGDSGAPVFRKGKPNIVVGVNSTGWHDSQSYSNWHVRLDDKTDSNVAKWLKSILAQ